MLNVILFIFQLFLLLVVVFLTFYLIFLLYSFFKGSPFVGSKKEDIGIIMIALKKLRKKYPFERFIDLGCGDGRVVLLASRSLGVKALGLDINPFLILFAKIKKILTKNEKSEFKVCSYEKFSPKKSDIIYLYHLPKLLHKIAEHLLKQSKEKDFIIVSYQFKIKNPKLKLIKKINTLPYPTFIYKPAF